MNTPFIRNHHYNLIIKQVELLQQACATVSDKRVVESVRYSAQSNILEALPNASELHQQLLNQLSGLHTAEQFQHYLQSLEPYRTGFPQVTGKQVAKLFPKVKKMKLPDLAAIDYRNVTYLGWLDVGTGRMFLIYHLDDQFVGLEGRFTPSRKGVCFLCNRHEELALFTAVTKVKPANASPDYYKAIGNYLCVDSEACNRNIRDVTVLENYVRAVTGLV
ncbi:FusB/FusC family EF-G-binding protein [Paenibacillus paeoniae]|uniref:Elongation factor G-binding protein n=1 Tax=Paenibacillus paeoniae TaxID=2292705 RepID=A0A371PN78_9BACL|nr:FusB/FusC family EF-G-binding protein [Paenibacillus paeoniae]REK77638.1 elongation factor G-binding protein [Paenibacillus paeoniae]